MKTLLALVLALSLGAATADAANVCVRKNGRLVLRPSCRAGERTFDPTGFAIAGPSGPVGPQGPAGDPAAFPLRLVDAIDQEVGEIHQIQPFSAWVAIDRPPLKRPVLFPVTAKGYQPGNLGQALVYYANADCAGVPFIRDDRVDVVRAQVCGPAAYYSDALSGELQMQSKEYDYGGAPCPPGLTATPRATCCENYPELIQLIRPAVRVDLVSLGLRPPFRAIKRQETIR